MSSRHISPVDPLRAAETARMIAELRREDEERQDIEDGCVPAPLAEPPIANGMTDIMKRMMGMVFQDRDGIDNTCPEFTSLFLRLRHLLDVYYSYNVFAVESAEFRYCDAQSMTDLGIDLLAMGMYLSFPGRRHNALMTGGLFKIMFKEETDVDIDGRFKDAYHDYEKLLKERSEDDVLQAAEQRVRNALRHRAAHKTLLFMMPIWYCYGEGVEGEVIQNQYQFSSWDALMKFSYWTSRLAAFSLTWKHFFNCFWHIDVLPDALIRTADQLLKPSVTQFLHHADGLPAIIAAWSADPTNATTNKSIRSIESGTWKSQDSHLISDLMKHLAWAVDQKENKLTASKTFSHILFEVYIHFGLEHSAEAQRLSRVSVFFRFLYTRLSRHPAKYRDQSHWRPLLKKWSNVSDHSKNRYRWRMKGRRSLLAHLQWPCGYENCDRRKHFQDLSDAHPASEWTSSMLDELESWGNNAKLCGGCRETSYCSAKCQESDWSTHLLVCDFDRGRWLRHPSPDPSSQPPASDTHL